MNIFLKLFPTPLLHPLIHVDHCSDCTEITTEKVSRFFFTFLSTPEDPAAAIWNLALISLVKKPDCLQSLSFFQQLQ